MGNWRKPQGETPNANDHQGRRPCYRKPPLGNRQSSYVPLWEKKFCSSVGSVSWRKLLEAKRYMYLHDNVVKWDDSACKEAFNNAKSRFWAEINGRPCNLSLPDPNIYIDDVDWDSSVDPELLLDLEKERNARITEVAENDQATILSDILQLNQSVACTGWGDAEADLSNGKCMDQAVILGDTLQLNHSFACTGWGDAEADLSNDKYNVNQWEDCIQNDVRKEYEWGNGWNGWNQWENYPNDKQQKMEGRAYGNWGTWHCYQKQEKRLGWHVPHTKPSNLPNVESQRSRRWRSGRRRKAVNFGY